MGGSSSLVRRKMGVTRELHGTHMGGTLEYQSLAILLFLLDEEILVDVIVVVYPRLFNYVFHL